MATNVAKTTQQAIDVFLYSKQTNGEIGGIGYWQTANGYTAITMHDLWANSDTNRNVLEALLRQVHQHHPNHINEFNDDTLWWAHCLMLQAELCRRTGRHKLATDYVNIVAHIWNHIRRSVIPKGAHTVRGMNMGGGVLWTTRPNEGQVNSISTGLFSELSALLASLSPAEYPTTLLPPRETLISAAQQSLDWITSCRYRSSDAVVLDNIDINTGESKDWTFTYTTGQTIAACVALFNATNDENHLELATCVASASLTRPGWIEKDGTLTESGAYGPDKSEAWKNDDAVGFKSVLVRSLCKLYVRLRDTKRNEELQNAIRKFLRWQYKSLTERDTNGKGQYGPWWNGPMDLPTSHSQLAVLDVMAAIRLVGVV